MITIAPSRTQAVTGATSRCQTEAGAFGWRRKNPTTAADVPAPPSGEVTVEGWVRADATGEGIDLTDHSTRSLSSVTVGTEIGQPVYGGSIDLRS